MITTKGNGGYQILNIETPMTTDDIENFSFKDTFTNEETKKVFDIVEKAYKDRKPLLLSFKGLLGGYKDSNDDVHLCTCEYCGFSSIEHKIISSKDNYYVSLNSVNIDQLKDIITFDDILTIANDLYLQVSIDSIVAFYNGNPTIQPE